MRYWRRASVAAVLLVSLKASAQSNVLIYGVIDYGLNFVNDAQTAASGGRTGSHQYAMSSSIMQGNRLGFRGTEDLGGGYQAIFLLENGFDIGTGALGQGGNLFGRQAYVGLSSP